MVRLSKEILLVCWTLAPALAHQVRSIHGLAVEQCGWSAASPLQPPSAACPRLIAEDVGHLGRQPRDWAPWTHRPYCADTAYCVFTNSMFQGNHGISIITTPKTAANSLHQIETSFRVPFASPPYPSDGPPYEVRDV